MRVAVVGKYTDYVDSYKSVQEALIHGGIGKMSSCSSDAIAHKRGNAGEPPRRYPIRNTDRSIGARLSGRIARAHGIDHGDGRRRALDPRHGLEAELGHGHQGAQYIKG